MRAGAHSDTWDGGLQEFVSARPRLFGIAYRILGSAVEAEDIVQDAWLRWQNTDRAQIHEPAAFLTTVTTRLAINLAQSARVRRESYVGPWLPSRSTRPRTRIWGRNAPRPSSWRSCC